ncbi:hypothetical protein KY339_00475, partial [Candidatus Woesearchaeota archaeon]|nr:hypothetical protein [Candidatus Woesearchaeota archaeon]
MSLIKKLNEIQRNFLLAEQAAVIAEHVTLDAMALSKRNDYFIGSRKRKAEAEERLKLHKRELDLVKYIENEAISKGVGVKQFIETLPRIIRENYEAARMTIEP